MAAPRNMPLRWRALLATGALLGSLLTGCGGGGGSGPVTLGWYIFPEPSGAFQSAADECSKNSGGRYQISYQKLPAAADGQRLQMVRRLAADDPSMDILGLDVTWAPEFAEAGWIRQWTGRYKQQAEQDTLAVPLQTATWKNKLYAVPYNTNTQLLWYRDDLVPNPPKTWDEMLRMAGDLAKKGKPHYVEIQGAQYEGLTVWFNTLVESAGGSILTKDAQHASMGPPAVTAAQTMSDLAHSPAADPSLSNQMEDQNRLAMESGSAAFELNYPFVYPSMKADKPDLFKHFKWALYPRVKADEPAHVTIGGIDLAIGAFSKHPDLAFQAALCLRNEKHQLEAAVKGGLPPTLRSIYEHPPQDFVKNYPFYKDILTALQTASVRPQTPAYQNVSIVISDALSPPSDISPGPTVDSLTTQIQDALESKGLIP